MHRADATGPHTLTRCGTPCTRKTARREMPNEWSYSPCRAASEEGAELERCAAS